MIFCSHSGGAFGSTSTSTSATSGGVTFGTSAVFGQTTSSRLIHHNLRFTATSLGGHILVAPAAEQLSDLSSDFGVCLIDCLFVDRI